MRDLKYGSGILVVGMMVSAMCFTIPLLAQDSSTNQNYLDEGVEKNAIFLPIVESSGATESSMTENSNVEASVSTLPIVFVSANGNDSNAGTSLAPVKTIAQALKLVQANGLINLLPGNYEERNEIKITRPVSIIGPGRDSATPATVVSRIQNNTSRIGTINDNKVIEINSSNVTLDGFTIDGHNGTSIYNDKLIYVTPISPTATSLTNIVVRNMQLLWGGEECLRFKGNVTFSKVEYSRIRECGRNSFVNGQWVTPSTKVGEGIYIGTAASQGPVDSDKSSFNYIHDNEIHTNAAECVNVKEGSEHNIIEFNACTGEKETKSAGIQIQGNNNIVRSNRILNNVGSGVGLSSAASGQGIANSVYYNEIKDNLNGGLYVTTNQQNLSMVCGNYMNLNTISYTVGSNLTGLTPQNPCTVPLQPVTRAIPLLQNALSSNVGPTIFEAEIFGKMQGNWRTVIGTTITYEVVDSEPSGGSKLTYWLSVPQAGVRYLWLRLYGINGSHNSVTVVWPNGISTDVPINQFNQWQWIKVDLSYNWNNGYQPLVIVNREDQTRIDKLLVTDSPTYIP